MNTNRNKYLILLFFSLLIIAHHFIGYLGHYGYDDMHYARLANDLSNGHFNPQDHFSFRITLLGLISLSYRLFGISDFTSALPSLLGSIATLALVFVVLKKERPAIIAIGLAFFSLNFWGLFYSDKIMPDALVTFFTFLVLFLIFAFKFRKRILPVSVYAFGAAFALFLGFNTKGNIILILPLLIYFFITDLLLKRDIKFWIFFAGSSFVLISVYFIYYQNSFGNAIIRFQAIAENSYLNLCSYSEQPFVVTLKRIGYQLFLLFIAQSLFTPFLFLLANPKEIFRGRTFLFNTETSFFVSSAFILFLSSNFMTISISGYSPMCLDPRHYLFIVPIAGIAATHRINESSNNKAFVLYALGLTTVAFVLSLINKNNTSWLLYLPLILALLVFYVFNKNRFSLPLFGVLFTIALLVNPIHMALYAKKVNFKKQERIFKETVLSLDKPALILTNQVQKNFAEYFNDFEDSELSILSYNEFSSSDRIENMPIYLFKNFYTRYLSNLSESQLPFFARHTDNYELLFEDSNLNLQLYKIGKLSVPKIIFSASNDFEKQYANWSNFKGCDKYAYSGTYSSLIEKYSSTLKVKLDTINTNNAQQLIISASFKILLMDNSRVSFVISTESGFWKGIDFKNQIKAWGSWMPITISEVIDSKAFRSDDTLILYLLNSDEEEVYLDDFSIELSISNPVEIN